MTIDIVASRWANEFEYNPHNTPARSVSAHGQRTMPEIMEAVRQVHIMILGASEPLNPWLMDRIYYMLESIGNGDGSARSTTEMITTAIATHTSADPDALTRWAHSHVAHRRYNETAATRMPLDSRGRLIDIYMEAQRLIIAEIGDILRTMLTKS